MFDGSTGPRVGDDSGAKQIGFVITSKSSFCSLDFLNSDELSDKGSGSTTTA